jgi:hypothetical protein
MPLVVFQEQGEQLGLRFLQMLQSFTPQLPNRGKRGDRDNYASGV